MISIPEDLPYDEYTDEQKAAVRMWKALGLKIEANYPSKGWGLASTEHPNWPDEYMGYWCYRIAPEQPTGTVE